MVLLAKGKRRILRPLPALLCLFGLLSASPVLAQDPPDREFHPLFSSSFVVNIGLFHPDKEFKIRVDGQVPGEEIDLEQEADAKESETTGAFSLLWRFGEKWSLAGQYWAINSGADWQLEEDYEWEDLVFKEGTFAEIGVDLDIYRVFMGRKFYTRPGQEFGAGVGLHWLELEAFIAGQVFVEDQPDTEFKKSTVSAKAPLPNIGAWYNYSWSPKWVLTTRFDWLDASVGDYSGGLINAQAGVHYQVFKNAGLGLSWNFFRIDLDVDDADWHGRVESRQTGPYLSLNINW